LISGPTNLTGLPLKVTLAMMRLLCFSETREILKNSESFMDRGVVRQTR